MKTAVRHDPRPLPTNALPPAACLLLPLAPHCACVPPTPDTASPSFMLASTQAWVSSPPLPSPRSGRPYPCCSLGAWKCGSYWEGRWGVGRRDGNMGPRFQGPGKEEAGVGADSSCGSCLNPELLPPCCLVLKSKTRDFFHRVKWGNILSWIQVNTVLASRLQIRAHSLMDMYPILQFFL